MNHTTGRDSRSLPRFALGALIGALSTAATAQDTAPSAPAPATSTAQDPNPYYLGVSQGFTHDSNVYRTPSGTSDNYSITSLLGGFDQPIGRQRVFGNANVSANRYQNETRLDHTSYGIASGLDWQTIEKLSGNLNLAMNQRLAAPASSTVVPGTRRNLAQTESIDARVRWGGGARVTLEGGIGYSKLDYSAPQYAYLESTQDSASLAAYYRPGALLRIGVAARVNRTDTPKAAQNPTTGAFIGNTVNGRNIDLLADYELSGFFTTNARLSYTKQTNSGISNADFSGLTGNLNLNYFPTAKLSFNLYASRDSGFNSSLANLFVQNGPFLTTVTGLYQNNRVTNSVGLGVGYAATAKIKADAGLRYARAKLLTTLVTTSGVEASPDTTDVSKSAYLGVKYEIARNWGLACQLAHETRDVSGRLTYAYTANSIGCTAQYTWR